MRFLILLLAIGCCPSDAVVDTDADTGMDSREEGITRYEQRLYCEPWQNESIVFDTFDVRDAVYYELRLKVSEEYIDWYGAEGGVGFEYPYEHLQVRPWVEPNEDGHVVSWCASRPGEHSLVWAWSELYLEWPS